MARCLRIDPMVSGSNLLISNHSQRFRHGISIDIILSATATMKGDRKIGRPITQLLDNWPD